MKMYFVLKPSSNIHLIASYRALVLLSLILIYEPRHEKTGFLYLRKQRCRPLKLFSAFVFATSIVQCLYFLNPKVQASCYLMWWYSPVCAGPGRKPRRQFFSRRGSYYFRSNLWVQNLAGLRAFWIPRHDLDTWCMYLDDTGT